MNCDICGEESPLRQLNPTRRGSLARSEKKVCDWCYWESDKDSESE